MPNVSDVHVLLKARTERHNSTELRWTRPSVSLV